MKKLKIFCAMFLVCLLSTGALVPSALAADVADNTDAVVYFSDGSYLVTSITYDSINTRQSVCQTAGKKHYDYYDSNHKLLWTFRAHGTFTYDGRSAEATSADYSYDIYDSAWSFNGATASYSGATSTAKGSFTLLIVPHSVTITLTCSPKGVLS